VEGLIGAAHPALLGTLGVLSRREIVENLLDLAGKWKTSVKPTEIHLVHFNPVPFVDSHVNARTGICTRGGVQNWSSVQSSSTAVNRLYTDSPPLGVVQSAVATTLGAQRRYECSSTSISSLKLVKQSGVVVERRGGGVGGATAGGGLEWSWSGVVEGLVARRRGVACWCLGRGSRCGMEYSRRAMAQS